MDDGHEAAASLAERIDRIESRQAITELTMRYAVAMDSRDIDTWVRLFVPDVDAGNHGRGREALRGYIEPLLRRFKRSFHGLMGHQIDFEGPDDATGVVYCRGEHEVEDRWIVVATCYFDRYRRIDGEWLFVGRREEMFYTADVNERPQEVGFDAWQFVVRPRLPELFPTWRQFWGTDAVSERAASSER